MSDRISSTAVHLYIHNKLFDLIMMGRFIQTNKPATKHGHTDPPLPVPGKGVREQRLNSLKEFQSLAYSPPTIDLC